jgi:DNA-binding transcriptional MocR family regulator
MRAAVARHFPHDTRISRPAGGYVLWVELPGDIDSMRLYRAALERGITIGPGRMFSVSDRYAAASG